MGRRLPAKQLRLYQSIDEILWRNWDPIGISDAAGARDEYHAYLPVVFRMALENASQRKIADYLFSVERERMGMDGNIEHCMDIAGLVLKVKNEIDD